MNKAINNVSFFLSCFYLFHHTMPRNQNMKHISVYVLWNLILFSLKKNSINICRTKCVIHKFFFFLNAEPTVQNPAFFSSCHVVLILGLFFIF